ncbi:unnamed protein product [Closterium sp. NIES-65]|nr:unnamed protein product [Closterium sp. NIES-65]
MCSGGPLPGSHCSVIAILYPGDLLKAEGQVCRTSIRHIDPHTGKLKHRDEAVRVLKKCQTHSVSDEKVGTGMLAATSFGWVAKQVDLLTGEKGRGATDGAPSSSFRPASGDAKVSAEGGNGGGGGNAATGGGRKEEEDSEEDSESESESESEEEAEKRKDEDEEEEGGGGGEGREGMTAMRRSKGRMREGKDGEGKGRMREGGRGEGWAKEG